MLYYFANFQIPDSSKQYYELYAREKTQTETDATIEISVDPTFIIIVDEIIVNTIEKPEEQQLEDYLLTLPTFSHYIKL